MIIAHYQTHTPGDMPKPAGTGQTINRISAQPVWKCHNLVGINTLSLYFGGI